MVSTATAPIRIFGNSGIGAPRTKDEKWYALIDLMTSDHHPGVIALGCFAQHLTFYSQQVRALNPIAALCNTGKLRSGDEISIVGAGLSGLTAAAAAARRGLTVHLFEKAGDPSGLDGRMPLQKDLQKRWIEPFIYDWPELPPTGADGAGKSKNVRAGLPLLDWEAAAADDVRRQIDAEFSATFKLPSIHCYHETLADDDIILAGGDGVTIKQSKDRSRAVLAVRYLILAVGFGTEDTSTSRYWTDDGYAGNEYDNKTFLVSGIGDGGLTDVMRLCISNFRHHDVISAFQIEGQALHSAIKSSTSDQTKLFMDAAAQIAKSPKLDELKKRNVTVFLTASPFRLFNGRASILNRLIIAWLLHEKRLTLIDAALRPPLPKRSASGSFKVEFCGWGAKALDYEPAIDSPHGWTADGGKLVEKANVTPADFHEIITRHGTGQIGNDPGGTRRKPLQVHFPAIYAGFSRNSLWWEQTPHWADWTRFPLWDQQDFQRNPVPLDPVIPQRRFSATEPVCVVLAPPETISDVWRIAAGVQHYLYKGSQIFALDAAQAFKSAANLGQAVRLLCQADIAVIDITGHTAETMLLLGIRAAVRRGLSAVTQQFPKALGEPEASDATFALAHTLPHLIQNVHVIGWRREDLFGRRLRRSIQEGAARLERLGPLYSDLGVYDAVRNLGADAQDFSELSSKDSVLFLGPFDKTYREKNATWLRARFDVSKTAKLSYIVETPSPELTTSMLYAGLRRTAMCVADWTKCRANVFFELGIRFAINKKPVISIIAAEEIARGKPKRAELTNLFALLQPHVYSRGKLADEDRRFEEFLAQCRKSLERRNFVRDTWPYAAAGIAPDFISRQVSASVGAAQEYWSIPVWDELTRAAEAIDGPDPHAHPVPPALFGTKAQTSVAALDRLIAAWYFMERRFEISGRYDRNDPVHNRWRAIGQKIVLRASLLGADYERIVADIKQALPASV